MQPLLFDQGLPGGDRVSQALSSLGFTALTVGNPGAPAEGSSDHDNCRWCATNGAVLVTHDRGKKNREILEALDQHSVDAVIVLKELRTKPPKDLCKALLIAEHKIDQIVSGRHRLRHHLRAGGGLRKP